MEEEQRYTERVTSPETSSRDEALRRKRRRAMLKKRRERQLRRARFLAAAAGVIAVVVLLILIVRAVRNTGTGSPAAEQAGAAQTTADQEGAGSSASDQAGAAQTTAGQEAADQTAAQDAPQVQLADPNAPSEEEALTLTGDTAEETAGQSGTSGTTTEQQGAGTGAAGEAQQPGTGEAQQPGTDEAQQPDTSGTAQNTPEASQEWSPAEAQPGSEESIDVMSETQEQAAGEESVNQPASLAAGGPGSETGLSEEVASFHPGYVFTGAEEADYIDSDGVQSSYALLVDVDSGEIVAGKDFEEQINPASMTKILTLLVAVEHLTDAQIENRSTETFTITEEIFTRAYRTGSSVAGWYPEDEVTLEDLLYGTILPSGADGAMGLAIYTAGSEEKFVEWMNQKLKELGLSDTAHFTNCIGLYDEEHYCTLTDMAAIMKAAVENDLCREVLSAHTYSTTSTDNAPDGIGLSNWFLRRIEDKDTHGEVVAAKTGFVKEAGNCAASYQVSDDGGHYICVTANAWSAWRCIYDHVEIYTTYTE